MDYKVSTITAVATISTCVDLDVFFENASLDGQISFVGKGSLGTVRTRGIRPEGQYRPRKKELRFFDHQVTVIFSTAIVKPSETHNIKVFHNGNIQLTGVKSFEGGREAVDFVAGEISRISVNHPSVLPLGPHSAPPVPANFRACLINSDFNAGYVIRRDRLYAIITGEPYGVRCVFETYYPGVKVQFMWNVTHATQDGVCRCEAPCSGRGDGSMPGSCRKVTMSVFQSGCCIITGAHTYTQLDHAHRFLTEVLVRHKDELVRPDLHEHVHKEGDEMGCKCRCRGCGVLARGSCSPSSDASCRVFDV